jgi:hypothetical protein
MKIPATAGIGATAVVAALSRKLRVHLPALPVLQHKFGR